VAGSQAAQGLSPVTDSKLNLSVGQTNGYVGEGFRKIKGLK